MKQGSGGGWVSVAREKTVKYGRASLATLHHVQLRQWNKVSNQTGVHANPRQPPASVAPSLAPSRSLSLSLSLSCIVVYTSLQCARPSVIQ